VSRDSLQRIHKGRLYARSLFLPLKARSRARTGTQDFDAFYEPKAAARAPQDDLLVISTDGKGIVMRHEDLREGAQHAAERSPRKPVAREREPNREAQCGGADASNR
jgi:hypothetical protein